MQTKMMMNSEQYENLIALMKEALKFYANIDNYKQQNEFELFKKIEIDGGSQARFVLKKLQETLDADKKLQEDYDRIIGETINAIENHPIDLTDIIKSMKNI